MKLLKSALVSSLLLAFSMTVAAKTIINGAGATFPLPVYSKWAEQYQKETGVQINYQGIGSGGGIRQIKAKTVDFGASDAPLTYDDLQKNGLIQFPMVMGAIVPVVNVPGIKAGEMKLTGPVLADIFLGKISKWNDPAIKKLNPKLNLPDRAIYVVHRSDGSGTTFNFTQYLDQVSKAWHKELGYGKDINWPTGIGGKGNAGVANFVDRTTGSIGYVEYAYAKQNNLAYTQMKSRGGKFLMPTMKTFQAAAANADWAHAKGYHLLLNNQPGEESWPLTAATFILLHKDQESADTAKAMVAFFKWSYGHEKYAEDLDYVPMPEKVVDMVEKTWQTSLKYNNQAIIK